MLNDFDKIIVIFLAVIMPDSSIELRMITVVEKIVSEMLAVNSPVASAPKPPSSENDNILKTRLPDRTPRRRLTLDKRTAEGNPT
jgi:hypothetical protein